MGLFSKGNFTLCRGENCRVRTYLRTLEVRPLTHCKMRSSVNLENYLSRYQAGPMELVRQVGQLPTSFYIIYYRLFHQFLRVAI